MTTTGTTTFALDLSDIIEEAFERCGLEVRSGWDVKTARRSLNLLQIDWVNRGFNLWTVDSGTIPLVAGTATYTLPADTVDIFEQVVRTSYGAYTSDIVAQRISVTTYAAIPNKSQTGRPIQVYVNRQATAPTITVWPVPDTTTTYTFVYWRMRRLQDAGNGPNTPDIPFRMIPALVAGLAYYIAQKKAPDRLAQLKADYEEAWMNASTEDRDRAPWRVIPKVRRY